MPTCPRCERENEEDVRFCGRCGLDLPRYTSSLPADESQPLGHCYRHPKVATNLSCGRCERPVCTKCAINGPAGIRCPECAKQNIAVRPGAIVHEVKRSVFSMGRFGPWGLYALLLILSTVVGIVRGCGNDGEPRGPAVEAPTRGETPAAGEGSPSPAPGPRNAR